MQHEYRFRKLNNVGISAVNSEFNVEMLCA